MLESLPLRCFVAVAEERHFGRAAERLAMAQSALSRQVQSLERALGARLLNRARRAAVTLTEAGRRETAPRASDALLAVAKPRIWRWTNPSRASA